jgi:sigma-B regulation protein RsbU (phosphoserine phosphatase)
MIELADLLEISQALNQSLERDEILNRLLLASMGRFAIGRGLVLLAGGEAGHFLVGAAKALPDAIGTPVFVGVIPESAGATPTDAPGYEFFVERKLETLVPLTHGGTVVGLLALGRKLAGEGFDEAELRFLTSLASIATPAIENSRVYAQLRSLNVKLDQKVTELNTLVEIGKNLVSTFDADEVLRLFTYALMGQLMLTRFLLVLKRPDRDLVQARGIKLGERAAWQMEGFWESLADVNEFLRIADEAHALAEYRVNALVPIRKDNVTHGFLGLGARVNGQDYTDEELAFAGALANQAFISLENAWLFRETIEKQKLEEELALASAIQRNLFPKRLPEIDGFELAARSTPTRHVGGDYYDMIELGDGRTLIAIADVSGKGTPASLLMSTVQASLRALADGALDLGVTTARINELIYKTTDFNKYATMVCGVLDRLDGTFLYTNAGHNPPYLLRAATGDLETLDAGGLPVGLMPGSSYECATVRLEPGDVLLLYTDGVSEAVNRAGVEFGEDRIMALLKEMAAQPATAVLERIASEVSTFSEGCPQADDITMVVLRCGRAHKR